MLAALSNQQIRDRVRARPVDEQAAISDTELRRLADELVFVGHPEAFRGGTDVLVILHSARLQHGNQWAQISVGFFGDRFAGLNFHPTPEAPDRMINMGFVSATDDLTRALAEANRYLVAALSAGLVPVDDGPLWLTRALFCAALAAHPRRS